MVDIRLLVDCKNHLGEGPLWDVEEQRLYWIDSSAAEIWSCRADGSDVKTYFVRRAHRLDGAARRRAAPCWRCPMASISTTSRHRRSSISAIPKPMSPRIG